MPFWFDLTKVKDRVSEEDWERLTTAPFLDGGEKRWHPIVRAINDLSMVCGFNSITEANAEEVHRRISQLERCVQDQPLVLLHSKYIREGDQRHITLRDVRALIGYRCNAKTLTPTQWNKHLLWLIDREIRRDEERNTSCLYDTIADYARRVSAAEGLEIVNCS